MITREQAEQAFREQGEHSNLFLAYEVRNLRLEPINTNDIGSGELPPLNDDLYVDLEESGWLCTYERRHRHQHERIQSYWVDATCYIVEYKPGPYVIE